MLRELDDALEDRVVVLVVDLLAEALARALVPAAVPVEPVPVEAVAAVGEAAEAVAWRAMPSPRALATPMLREATRARLRAAGWGRFAFMRANVRSGCEPRVSDR